MALHMGDRRIDAGSSTSEVLAALRELVEALDRRVPHAERSGEVRIRKDAAMLRSEAMTRIAALQRAGPSPAPQDQELVNAIRTDDGSPTPSGEQRPAPKIP
jgi:hypothetical protein